VREHARAIRSHECEQIPCGGDRFVGDRCDPVEEEVEPALPVAIDPHGVEATMVVLAVPLEEEAQIEERLGQQLPVLEQQRHEQAPNAAVAVEVRVDGLECVQSRPHEGGRKSPVRTLEAGTLRSVRWHAALRRLPVSSDCAAPRPAASPRPGRPA
jgi:hypothetical protein